MKYLLLLIPHLILSLNCFSQQDIPDLRNIKTGTIIPDLSYSDQPYIVKTDDGAWLVCLTTGAGHEGDAGQIVITQRSVDKGKTWDDLVQVEPPDGPEASYATMLKVPSGRVYIFYNHNTDNLREYKSGVSPSFPDGIHKRVDSQGHFVFKYSDDHGKTWSKKRYDIPQRLFEIDKTNLYNGELLFFWNVGKPFILNNSGYVPIHKCQMGRGFFSRNEGALLMSKNILTENDPEKINWETMPEGEVGLRTPQGGGPISAEQSFNVLSDGSLYAVYRSIDGYPVNSYSRDGGRTWDTPQYKKYANGRTMKHPRAANFAWKCNNGKFLYWFHNHGGHFVREREKIEEFYPYQYRNPVWLCGGVEADGPDGKIIKWSQPEIILYDDDPLMRMSYPDLVEQDGEYYLTETQKMVARLHKVDEHLLEQLWGQFDVQEIAQNSLVLEFAGDIPSEVDMPELSPFRIKGFFGDEKRSKDMRTGFAIDLWVTLESLEGGQVLLSNQSETGDGFILQTTSNGTIELAMNDEQTQNSWECDPGKIQVGKRHHIVVIVDGGPKIISFVIDGILNDGDEYRQFGWGRFSPFLRDANGADKLKIAPELKGNVESVRIYNRHLLTSEAIGNYRAGIDE